jgi:hypothetical protein
MHHLNRRIHSLIVDESNTAATERFYEPPRSTVSGMSVCRSVSLFNRQRAVRWPASRSSSIDAQLQKLTGECAATK